MAKGNLKQGISQKYINTILILVHLNYLQTPFFIKFS